MKMKRFAAMAALVAGAGILGGCYYGPGPRYAYAPAAAPAYSYTPGYYAYSAPAYYYAPPAYYGGLSLSFGNGWGHHRW